MRDARLLDPVFVEVSDTHGIETSLLTAVDFKGRVMWSSPGDHNLNLRGRMGVSFMDASAELLALVNSQ